MSAPLSPEQFRQQQAERAAAEIWANPGKPKGDPVDEPDRYDDGDVADHRADVEDNRRYR